ncbi:MAG: FtsX-like permease family protein [Gemmataceae bacterium]
MRLGGLVRFALGGLWRQKVRTGLTVAGVAVGACGLAFSLALGIGLREFIDREFKGRPAFWTVHVHPGGGKPVAEADIPPEITRIDGDMSDDRRARLRRLRVEDYQRSNTTGPAAKLTPDRLAELAALPDVDRVEAWHNAYGWVQAGADSKRQSGQVVSGPLDRTSLPDRVVAGRLPAGDADEVAVSEHLLYQLGLKDEAAVTAALGRPVTVNLGGPPPKGATVAFLFGVNAGDLTGGQQDALARVAEVLPKSLDRLDLTAEEKRGLAKLLAAAKPVTPPPANQSWSPAPAELAVRLVGVVRDLPNSERWAEDRTDPWEARSGEVFLSAAAGDRLFGQQPWIKANGYHGAQVKVTPGGDLRRVVEGVAAAGFEKHDLLKFYDATRRQVVLTAAGLNLFALLALLVACLGITNTLVTSVVERTREIGILKAVGASGRQVWGVFLAEGAVIGLAGGLLGLALAAGLTVPADALVRRLIEQSTTEKILTQTVFEFPLWLATATVGFAVGVTTLAAAYPARRAARIDPIEALRHS